jgi:hypothetical protein
MQIVTCPSVDASFQAAAAAASRPLAVSSADIYMAALAFDALLFSRILQPMLPLSRATAIQDIKSLHFPGASGTVAWTVSDLSIRRDSLKSSVTVFSRGENTVRQEPVATISFGETDPLLIPAPGAPSIRWPDNTAYPPRIAVQNYVPPAVPPHQLSPEAIRIISGLTSALAVLAICVAVAVCLALRARQSPPPRRQLRKPASGLSQTSAQSTAGLYSPGALSDRDFGVAYPESLHGAGGPPGPPGRWSSVIENVTAWLTRSSTRLEQPALAVARVEGSHSHTGSAPPELWLTDRQGSSQQMRHRSKGSLRKRASALFGLSSVATNGTPRRSHRSAREAARLAFEVRYSCSFIGRIFTNRMKMNIGYDHTQCFGYGIWDC